MNETNLTQRVKSTDISALKIFFSKGYEENFEKKRNLFRTTSFYNDLCFVRILTNIVMVYVRAAMIIEALKYELEN